jgi:hypothetical protein
MVESVLHESDRNRRTLPAWNLLKQSSIQGKQYACSSSYWRLVYIPSSRYCCFTICARVQGRQVDRQAGRRHGNPRVKVWVKRASGLNDVGPCQLLGRLPHQAAGLQQPYFSTEGITAPFVGPIDYLFGTQPYQSYQQRTSTRNTLGF